MTPAPRTLWLAILLAVAFRVAVFVWMSVSPIANEGGNLLSPLLLQRGIDFPHYWNVYLRVVEVWPDHLGLFFAENRVPLPGPGFLALLAVFKYQETNTLPLSLFYLAQGIAFAALWLAWMWRQGVPAVWLSAFALLPNPVWLSANISPDLPFALVTAGFFLVYVANEDRQDRYILGFAVAVAALLFRPNAVILLLFLAADFLLRTDAPPRVRVWGILVALGLFLPAFYYYAPSFSAFSSFESAMTYFGTGQADYLGGAFESLPELIDRPLSWLSLAGAKLLYFVGLRPTYGITPALLVAARAAAGIVLLPGMVYAIWYAPRRTKLFLIVFMLPFVLGASQDRYNLPILPILFYYGALFYIAAWSRVRGRLRRQGDG